MPSRQLKAFLKEHLDRTLGERQQPQKAAVPPTQQGDILRTSTELSRLVMQSMSSPQWTQVTATEVGNFYTNGVTDAMRMMQEQESDTIHKGFTEVQRGALQGFCMATMWDKVPMIWKQIEKCKSDMDLRRVLTRKWGEY
jgi:hypothetical protein